MSRWFRFYSDAVHHPKVQRLSGDQFKAWVNLLCLAADNNGALPSTDDLAFTLRMAESKVESIIGTLKKAGLLDDAENGLVPHNWDRRQYASDNSTERSRKHRERHRETVREMETQRCTQQPCNVAATPSEADTEQIQNRTDADVADATTRDARANSGGDTPDCQVLARDLADGLLADHPTPGNVQYAYKAAEMILATSADPVAVANAIRRSHATYREYWARARPKFIPQFHKWLNDGDYLHPPPASALAVVAGGGKGAANTDFLKRRIAEERAKGN